MYKFLPVSIFSGLILGIFFLPACSETVHVNAPPKDIWVVYGVLNPQEDYQYLRIAKSFLPDDDAVEYAKNHDTGARGLEVTLSGEDHVYQAVEIDSILKDTSEGDFGPVTNLYRVKTTGEKRLKEDGVYTLNITSPIDSSLKLTAYTRIPPRPKVTFPVTTINRGEKCLPVVKFEDSVIVYFRKSRGDIPSSAMRYELRVFLNYFENGIQKSIHTKPTRLFYQDKGCNHISDQALCYQFAKAQILNQLKAILNNPDSRYSYDHTPLCGNPFTELPNSVEIQVTAVDTFLSKYIISNDPTRVNFNTIRREYTNIEGTADAVGVFGSIAYHDVAVGLSPCVEYQLGLNTTWGSQICD